ncbi:unnamed protein product [Dracunculus medinensis]|uniref:Uncharacterized protein n=1 Tax=Dracunculus medinensis TaxID=318479 RepID=A0A0N4UCQ0_DRAME|nr:unnamed protein product [Dracunculus medinensis]
MPSCIAEREGSQAYFLLSKIDPSLTHNNPYKVIFIYIISLLIVDREKADIFSIILALKLIVFCFLNVQGIQHIREHFFIDYHFIDDRSSVEIAGNDLLEIESELINRSSFSTILAALYFYGPLGAQRLYNLITPLTQYHNNHFILSYEP